MTNEFSVFFFYPDESYTCERTHLSAEDAVKFAHEATKRPAAMIGFLKIVMITDSDDFCVFKWEHGKGVVFPKKEEISDGI